MVGTNNSVQNRMFIRSETGGAKTPFAEVFTSYNTNFNEFGDGAKGDAIAFGFAANGSIASFLLPLNSTKEPTSMTVTSTFELRTIAGTLISGGHTPTLSVRSHAKGALIQISTSGLTTDQPLVLWTETNTSQLVFNF